MRENGFSHIVPVFDEHQDYSNSLLYKNVMINTLQKILPKGVLQGDFKAKLPLVASLPSLVYCDHVPCQMSFYVVCPYRSNAFKFFLEMISRWLVPGKLMNVVLMYTADFRLSEEDPDIYSVCEVKIKIETKADLDVIQTHLPIIETEICLGMGSSYYAQRILELKGLLLEEKTAVIHENIARILKRFPRVFQNDLYKEMQHVLVQCREEFKEARLSRHLSKIITLHYVYRRVLRECVNGQRHIIVKLFASKLYPQRKKVLSLVVGVNFLSDKEVFDENHLIAAVQNYFPQARAIERSFFANRHGSEKIITFYVEIENQDGSSFSLEERLFLQKQLPNELKERIEPMMHPLVMPCNEEEIMRNILSLSHQLRYLRDMPQVFISFDQQTHEDLYFIVTMVRVLKPNTKPVQELLKRGGSGLDYHFDRCKRVGLLRKKYPKEASVIRVRLSKSLFVRRDHSIDLQKARQTVVSELSKALGEIRDYNGGMQSKQNELLSDLKKELADAAYDDLLLENFFYSLTPVIMRTLLDPETLKTLFMMLLELKSAGAEDINVRIEPSRVFIVIATEDKFLKGDIAEQLAKFSLQSNELAVSVIKAYGFNFLSYIYQNDDPEKQQAFCQLIQTTTCSLAGKG